MLDAQRGVGNTLGVERIRNGWRLAKASWHLLSQDRELVAIPIVAGLLSLIVFGAVGGSGIAAFADDDGDVGVGGWILLAIATLLATWVSVIGQAAVISGAAQRMDGDDPTVGSSFAGARSRTGRLFEWAVLATVVAIVLDTLQERLGILGNVLASLGNMAFSVLSFLALPVIVFEDVGAIDGFKRSSQLLRGTWGEQLTFTFGLGLIGLLAALPGVAVAAALAVTGVSALQVLGFVIGALWIIAVVAISSALSAVFKAALYRYATEQPVDVAFDTADLSGAFRRKSTRRDAAPA